MKKLIEFLISKIKVIILIYLLAQITLIFFYDIEYRSDSLYYYSLAQECVEQGEMYPAKIHLYEDYLVAPLYINSLIIILHIYNSPEIISIFNLLVILFQLLILYKLTCKLFSIQTALLTVIFYLFYINTIGLVLQNYTELFFTLLISTSIYFLTDQKKIKLIFAGIFIGAAIAVRPLGWALLLAILAVQFVTSMKSHKLVTDYFNIYLGSILFILLFGSLVYFQFGKFEFTSTTGPVNLLIGANNDATGAFNSIVHEKGKAGYIVKPDSLTYQQKNEFYSNRATTWIKAHPLKWILLAPLKFAHTYGWDDISISSLLGFDETNFARVLKILVTGDDLDSELSQTTITEKAIYLLTLVIAHIYYYFLFAIVLFGIYTYIKNNSRIKTLNIVLLFCLFATIMIMITVGTPRYKYPMFILLLPFAANYLITKFKIGVIGGS